MPSVTAAEEKRFRSALACLDRAVHPNTMDGEALLSVQAFRRKANGTTLTQICEGLFDESLSLSEYQSQWKKRFDAQQQQITTLMGENIDLNAVVAESRKKLKEAEQERQSLQKLLEASGKSQPRRERETTGEPRPSQPAVIYPVQYTKIIWARFDDAFWDDLNWSTLRQNCIFHLLDKQLPFQEVNKTFFSIVRGPREKYRYFPDYDIGIKTRSASEICNEVLRAWDTLGIRVKICISYPTKDKGPKKENLYPEGLAFPGAQVVLTPVGQPE